MKIKSVFILLLAIQSLSLSPAFADIYKGYEEIGRGHIQEESTPGNSAEGLKNTLLSQILNGPEGEEFKVTIPAGEHMIPDLEDKHTTANMFERVYTVHIKHQPQKNEAHLVFVIPGFGASSKIGVAPYLSEFLKSHGMVTISINSPANPEFILHSSSLGIPGVQSWDAYDIYSLLLVVKEKVAEKFGYHFDKVSVVGASLGSINAFHLAKIDRANQNIKYRESIDFYRVISMNPPISNVYGSTAIDTFVAKSLADSEDFDFSRMISSFYNLLASLGLTMVIPSNYAEVVEKSAQARKTLEESRLDDEQLKFLVGFGFGPTVKQALEAGFTRDNWLAEGYGQTMVRLSPIRFFTGFQQRYSFSNWVSIMHGSLDRYMYDTLVETGGKILRLEEKFSFSAEKYPHLYRAEEESIGYLLPIWQEKPYNYDFSHYHLITWHDDFLLRSTDPDWIKENLSGGKKGNSKVFYNGGGHLGGYWQKDFQDHLLNILK